MTLWILALAVLAVGVVVWVFLRALTIPPED